MEIHAPEKPILTIKEAAVHLSIVTVGILITAISAGGILGPIVFGWLSDRFSRVRMLQVSLALSCAGTLWVAHLGPGVAMLFVSLLLYSAFTSSRGTQTQAIVADAAPSSPEAGMLIRVGLLNYVAGALLMPYTAFAEAARAISELAG